MAETSTGYRPCARASAAVSVHLRSDFLTRFALGLNVAGIARLVLLDNHLAFLGDVSIS